MCHIQIISNDNFIFQVYLSHNKTMLQTVLPTNVEQKPGIKHIYANSVVFKNDEEIEVDIVLFCTGYLYNFPFLSEEIGVEIEDERIWPLYKHLIHPHYTNLSFIGILKTICPFPLFDIQVQFTIAVIDASMKLPCEEEMRRDIEDDFKKRLSEGLPVRYAHTMGTRQWQYSDNLSEMAMLLPIPRVVEKLYDYVHEKRDKDIAHYKSGNYRLKDKESFTVLES